MLVSVTGLIWWGGGTLASLQCAADRLASVTEEEMYGTILMHFKQDNGVPQRHAVGA